MPLKRIRIIPGGLRGDPFAMVEYRGAYMYLPIVGYNPVGKIALDNDQTSWREQPPDGPLFDVQLFKHGEIVHQDVLGDPDSLLAIVRLEHILATR